MRCRTTWSARRSSPAGSRQGQSRPARRWRPPEVAVPDRAASQVDADADRAGTPLPRWVQGPSAGGAPELVVPAPPEAARLAAALGVPGRTLVLAALVRTVAM